MRTDRGHSQNNRPVKPAELCPPADQLQHRQKQEYLLTRDSCSRIETKLLRRSSMVNGVNRMVLAPSTFPANINRRSFAPICPASFLAGCCSTLLSAFGGPTRSQDSSWSRSSGKKGLTDCKPKPATFVALREHALFRRVYGFHGHGLALQAAFHSDLLAGQLIQLRFMAFKGVHLVSSDECILLAVFHTHAGAFSRSLVLGHMCCVAHGITDRSGEAFLLSGLPTCCRRWSGYSEACKRNRKS